MFLALFAPSFPLPQFINNGTTYEPVPSIPLETALAVLESQHLRLGDCCPPVKTLQSLLQSLSLYHGCINGHFGTQTRQAVCKLQKLFGLAQTGVFDQSIWYALTFWT